ncbi:MAG: porphobilinogen synthase, partial [bacterium]|nr:porphobilinogen synthase [bacterium]
MTATVHKIGSFPSTRLRRNREHEWLRRLVCENTLTTDDLIWPLFIREKDFAPTVDSMPGVQRWTLQDLPQAVDLALKANIPAVGLFPVIPENKKDPQGQEATRHDNLICQAIRLIKDQAPELGVIVDAALDPYTTHRHDGVLKGNSVDNDASLEILCQQALASASAGANMISPSDMMDGRVGAIRQALDAQGHKNVGIMSYAAKYNSAFYGPFRDILGSKAQTDRVGVSKLTYQMSPSNSDEALREVSLDIEEGADSVMVKPGLPYLDIVQRIKETFHVPTFVYHISGEYAMLHAAAQKGWLDYDKALLECMIAFKRAGANGVWTYAALDVSRILD